MNLRRGDIVLVPFPFTNLTSEKVRPAVIISADPQSEDVVLAFISSAIPHRISGSDFIINEFDADFFTTGLKVASVFKFRKILTLHPSQILRYLGHLTPSLKKQMNHCLVFALGLHP